MFYLNPDKSLDGQRENSLKKPHELFHRGDRYLDNYRTHDLVPLQTRQRVKLFKFTIRFGLNLGLIHYKSSSSKVGSLPG